MVAARVCKNFRESLREKRYSEAAAGEK